MPRLPLLCRTTPSHEQCACREMAHTRCARTASSTVSRRCTQGSNNEMPEQGSQRASAAQHRPLLRGLRPCRAAAAHVHAGAVST